jgi:hypothetical protein
MNKEKVEKVRAVVNSPIIYIPHKDTLKPAADPGLSTLIENAMTPQEVKNLLTKGQLDYKKASAKTLRKWQKIAANRIAELSK